MRQNPEEFQGFEGISCRSIGVQDTVVSLDIKVKNSSLESEASYELVRKYNGCSYNIFCEEKLAGHKIRCFEKIFLSQA